MENNSPEVTVALQVQRPVEVVFDAIVNPSKMSNYFISSGSGRMETGRQLKWQFPEFEIDFPIQVDQIIENEFISYHWKSDGKEFRTEMILTSVGQVSTIVKICEKCRNGYNNDVRWLTGNTEGWANFLACLKAYLEYGINLRKGAFDFLRTQRT